MLRRLFFHLAYFRNPPWDTGISPPELLAFIQNRPVGRALDLGCGTGTNVITLAQHGWQVTGIDFVGKAIATARRKARQAGIQADFFTGDVTRLDHLSGPFELILDIGCFHSLAAAGRPLYLAQVSRLLATGGTYMLYAFFKDDPGRGPGITTADLQPIAAHLQLVTRQDGNERGRSSAWFTYRPLPLD
jgi:SAM-dependent methyltransferase